jgi:spore coat protein U-like protein
MRTIFCKMSILFAFAGLLHSAEAAITCTAPTSTGFSTAYVSTGVVPNISQGTVSFNCTRTLAGDATTILLTANNGTHASGVQNRTQKGTQRILYEVYKNSACGSVWSSVVVSDFWTLNLLNILGAQPVTVSYWGCITAAGQVVAAGSYTDTVTMQVRANTASRPALSVTGTFPVSIVTPASLSITTAPGNVAFNYTAFGAAANSSTTFATLGTLNLPYTMSLDAYSGVISGLNFVLTLDGQGSAVSARGTGAAQTHTIHGTMPAGQAGTCNTGSCGTSQVHTVTITY